MVAKSISRHGSHQTTDISLTRQRVHANWEAEDLPCRKWGDGHACFPPGELIGAYADSLLEHRAQREEVR